MERSAFKKLISMLLSASMLLPGAAALAEDTVETDVTLNAEQMQQQSEREAAEKEREKIRAARKASAAPGSVWSEGLSVFSLNPPDVSLMSSEYEEVVYISTVEELLAIDGHDQGYYELQNDIDLSGREWTPLYLNNAAFNGNGYTISGMTIKQEHTTKHIVNTWTDADGNIHDDSWDYRIQDVGLLCGYDNYVYDLTMTNVDIDFTVSELSYANISPLGNTYADNCKIYGAVNVIDNSGNRGNYIYGINSGNDCEVNLNITVEYCDVYGLSVYGICDGTSCTFEGDITVESSGDSSCVYGIRDGTNCTFEGDISSTGLLYGIDDATGCTINGNLSSEYHIYLISGSDNCAVNGDIWAAIYLSGINRSSGCMIDGNLTSGGGADGIDRSSDCVIRGSITAEGQQDDNFSGADGIYQSDNCTIYGSIYGASSVTGIRSSDGCVIFASLKSDGYGSGIDYSKNSHITGDITCRELYQTAQDYYDGGGGYGRSFLIYDSENCYIGGTIFTELPRDGSPIPVQINAQAPYIGGFRCDRCSEYRVSDFYIDYTPHQCNEWDTPGQYLLDYDIIYDSGISIPFGEEEILPVPAPTMTPASYSVRIIDELSEQPFADATVTIGGASHTTDANGVVVLTNAPRSGGIKVETGGSVIYTDANFTPVPNQMNTVAVNGLIIDAEDINLGGSGAVNMQGPVMKLGKYEFRPFVMPTSFDFNFLDAVQYAYDYNENTYKIIVGTAGDMQGKTLGRQKLTDDFNNKFKKLKINIERWKNGKITPEAMSKATKKGFANKQKPQIGAQGYIEVTPEKDKTTVNGGFSVVLGFELQNGMQMPPTYLIYLTYSLKGEVGAGFELECVSAKLVDPQFNVIGDFHFNVTPGAGVGLGLRKGLAAEIGLEGTLDFDMKFPVEDVSRDIKSSLSASVYGLVNILGYEFKNSKKFANLEIWPNVGNFELMSMDAGDEPQLVDRSYLDAVPLYGISPETFQSNIYPYSDVQTVRLSDGRVIMVWLDDDALRDDINRTALYYSILENGVWSAAAQIENDGTADYEFDLKAYGSNAAIVWQNSEAALANTADENAMAANICLSYAEFDGSAWGTPIEITSGEGDYEFNPTLYYSSDGTYISWAQNADNDPYRDHSPESIYRVSVSDGSAGSRETVGYDLSLVYDMTIGIGGKTAYISDKDGNTETSGSVLYIDEASVYDNGSELFGLQQSGDNFLFTENGSLNQISANGGSVSALYDASAPTDMIRLVDMNGTQAAVYEVQDGFKSNLYASYYENSEWTNSVPITDYTEKIRSWDAWLDDNGKVNVCAVLAEISVDGENEVTQSVRLSNTLAEPIEDIAATYISTEDEIIRERTASFEIGVENNSRAKEFTVTLTGESCGEIYSQTVAADDVVSVSAAIPEDFAKQTITATVTAADMNESDTANNSVSEVFGAADLNVKLRAGSVTRTGSASAVITNNGCEDAENAVLTVKDADGNLIAEKNLGTVAAGEKKTVRFELDKSYYTGENEYGSKLIAAEIATTTAEAADYNNSTYYSFKAQSVRLDANSIAMEPGDEYTMNVTVYPENAADAPIYAVSSDEAVATVDENGKITAFAEGTATISYMTPSAPMSAKLTVYVRKMGTPEITTAEYTDYSSEDDINGQVSVNVNTSACLADGETEQMITAVYAEDGTLITLDTHKVTAAEQNSFSVYTSGKKPKRIKVMLWSSLAGMKPASYAAETEVREAGDL